MIFLFDSAVKTFDTQGGDPIDRVTICIRQGIPVQNDSVDHILIHKTKKIQFLRSLRCDHAGFHRIKIDHLDLSGLIPALKLPCSMCIRCRNSKITAVNMICQDLICILINIDLIEIT